MYQLEVKTSIMSNCVKIILQTSKTYELSFHKIYFSCTIIQMVTKNVFFFLSKFSLLFFKNILK